MAPITRIVWCVSRFAWSPSCLCDVGPALRDPLLLWGPLCVRLVLCPWFFERHCCFTPLNVFAFFVTFLLFLCIFVRLCVHALRVAFAACVGTVHGVWYWYACHASHHRRRVHHDVHHVDHVHR